MTIRQLVEDAVFLAEHRRFLGALTTVLAAISGSARKIYPKEVTPSRIWPKDKRGMGDKEAFSLFLKCRLAEERGIRFANVDQVGSMLTTTLGGKEQSLESILYEQFRCSLSHEGKLPATVEFDEQRGFNLADRSYKLSIADGVLKLEHGWLGLLVHVVTHARCNATEFGVEHYEIQPKPGIDFEGLTSKLVDEFQITPGRVEVLRRMVEFATPESIATASSAELNEILTDSLKSGNLNGGCLTALVNTELATWDGALTERGMSALKRLADGCTRVRVI